MMNTQALLTTIESLTWIGLLATSLSAGGRRWARVFIMVWWRVALPMAVGTLAVSGAAGLKSAAGQWLCLGVPAILGFALATFLVVHRRLTIAPAPLGRLLRHQPVLSPIRQQGPAWQANQTQQTYRGQPNVSSASGDQAGQSTWSRARPVSSLMFGDPGANPDQVQDTGDCLQARRIRSNIAFAWQLKHAGVLDRLPSFWSLPVPVEGFHTTVSAAFAVGEKDLLLVEVIPAVLQHDASAIAMHTAALTHAATSIQHSVGAGYTVRAFLVIGQDPLHADTDTPTVPHMRGTVSTGPADQFVEMLVAICERMTAAGYVMGTQEAADSPLAAYFAAGQRAAKTSV